MFLSILQTNDQIYWIAEVVELRILIWTTSLQLKPAHKRSGWITKFNYSALFVRRLSQVFIIIESENFYFSAAYKIIRHFPLKCFQIEPYEKVCHFVGLSVFWKSRKSKVFKFSILSAVFTIGSEQEDKHKCEFNLL